MISAQKAKQLGVTTMFTYSHANTPLGQPECMYYLSYFIKKDMTWSQMEEREYQQLHAGKFYNNLKYKTSAHDKLKVLFFCTFLPQTFLKFAAHNTQL